VRCEQSFTVARETDDWGRVLCPVTAGCIHGAVDSLLASCCISRPRGRPDRDLVEPTLPRLPRAARSRVIALCTHGASYRCANTPSFWCRPPMLNLACHDGRPMHSVQSRDASASQSLCRFSAPISNLPGLTPPKITAWPERVISAQRYKQNTIMYTKMSASGTDISLPVRHSPRSFLTPRADILPWRTAGPFCDSQLTLY